MARVLLAVRITSKPTLKTNSLRRTKATTANIPDSEVLDELLDKEEDRGQPLHADSAYRSENLEKACLKKRIISCIHGKGYRGNLLGKRQ